MTQSRDTAILIEQNGELAEFGALLSELGLIVETCTQGLPPADALEQARLVVVPAARLLEGETPNLRLWPRMIVVVENSGKTLTAHLRRIGVSLVIRSSIHPRTLRLVLLHEIYRGPERRHRKRTLIGHPIRIRGRLFPAKATLLELSPTGARLEMAHVPKIGRGLTLILGRDLTGTRPLKLHTRVVRCIRPPREGGRQLGEVGVELLDPRKRSTQIDALLERFALGPAAGKARRSPLASPHDEYLPSRPSLPASPPDHEPPPSPSADISNACSPAQPELDLDLTHGAEADLTDPDLFDALETDPADSTRFAWEDESDDSSPDEDPNERRRGARVAYDHRFVALGEEAARVLVGRNLSPSGMRIAWNPAVEVGDVLRLALHCGTEREPLVVIADALRDDGEEGIVLSFRELAESQCLRLDQIITQSGPIEPGSEHEPEEDASLVVGEVLENRRMIENASPAEAASPNASAVDAGESVEDAR